MVLLCSATVCANCRSADGEAALPVTDVFIVSSVFLNLTPVRRYKVTKNYTEKQKKRLLRCFFRKKYFFYSCMTEKMRIFALEFD